MEIDKAEEKRLKRKNQEAFGYGQGEDMSDTDSDDEKQQKGGLKQRSREVGQQQAAYTKL